jgi:hypothetical protein
VVKGLLLASEELALAEALVGLQRLVQRLARIKAHEKNPSRAQLLKNPELLEWLIA